MVDLGGGPEVGGIRKALKFPGTADFHPVQYCRGLAKAFEKYGGKIYERTRVLKTEGDKVCSTPLAPS
jgi:glycine/D-amino acid oxidase-like deaminating enzyme